MVRLTRAAAIFLAATFANGAGADAWDDGAAVGWTCTFSSAPKSAQVRLSVNDEGGGLRSGPATVATPSEEFRLQGALTATEAKFTDGLSGPVILTIRRSDGSALLTPVARGTCVLR